MSEEELRRKARVRAEAKFYFYIDLIVYGGVNLALCMHAPSVSILKWKFLP